MKRDHPEVIFLAEAFTRPKVMYRLAKLGFSQSYTYFTWRNNAAEMEEYLTELTHAAGLRLLPPELLAEHARHPARGPADRRPGRRSRRASCWRPTLSSQLRHLRPAVRAGRATAARARFGGVPRLGEVPAADLGPDRRRAPARPDRARQRRARASTRRCRRTSGCCSIRSTTRTCCAGRRTRTTSATCSCSSRRCNLDSRTSTAVRACRTSTARPARRRDLRGPRRLRARSAVARARPASTG